MSLTSWYNFQADHLGTCSEDFEGIRLLVFPLENNNSRLWNRTILLKGQMLRRPRGSTPDTAGNLDKQMPKANASCTSFFFGGIPALLQMITFWPIHNNVIKCCTQKITNRSWCLDLGQNRLQIKLWTDLWAALLLPLTSGAWSVSLGEAALWFAVHLRLHLYPSHPPHRGPLPLRLPHQLPHLPLLHHFPHHKAFGDPNWEK